MSRGLGDVYKRQILGRQRCARSLGGTLRIQHAPEQLRRVLRLANIPCTDAGQEE